MRVLFACTQGAGHLQPMLPFADACGRAGHDVLVTGPPSLTQAMERAGRPFHPGAAPDDAALGRVWSRVPSVSYAEAERLVVAEIFATLNVAAMLPTLREIVREWRPDVVVRESAEFASAVAADEAGVPHVQVAISLLSAHMEITEIARDTIEAWVPGLTDRILATPCLTLFPAGLEDPAVAGPPRVLRFRDPAGGVPPAPLADWWDGDTRPLVYVTFGSVAASVPTAAPIYGIALEAVDDLPARVLLTTGEAAGDLRLPAAGPHVAIERWVPQTDVLPHASVVVCHGGSGTTLGAIAGGVPLVITPLFADQPHNARRVAAVGAGIAVGPGDPAAPRTAIDPAALRAAVLTVLHDEAYAAAAQALAAEIAELPATDEAVGELGAATA